jgi:hypothetical protein
MSVEAYYVVGVGAALVAISWSVSITWAIRMDRKEAARRRRDSASAGDGVVAPAKSERTPVKTSAVL